MRSEKRSVFLWGIALGLAVVVVLFGPLGMTGRAQAAPEIILVTFTEAAPVQYADLSGNVLGEGVHVGELLCVGDNCSQKIEFEPLSGAATAPLVYEYKFKTRQAYDPTAEIMVVTGTGTIAGAGPKTKFTFTGTFQNNGDGTIRVRYDASNPEASFIFPAAPGAFNVFSNN